MEFWALRQLLLLGILLRTSQGQGDETNSEEERRALMLKVSLLFPGTLLPTPQQLVIWGQLSCIGKSRQLPGLRQVPEWLLCWKSCTRLGSRMDSAMTLCKMQSCSGGTSQGVLGTRVVKKL